MIHSKQSIHQSLNILGEDIYIEASAGTGKTSSLVSRVCHLIEKGTKISEIAVITFTRAAASELRYRIREKLKDMEQNHSLKSDKDVYINTINELHHAPIQTIDSFALSILSEIPDIEIAYSLDPLIDEEKLFDSNRWNSWIKSKHLSELTKKCFSEGVSNPYKIFRSIITQFHRNYDLIESETFEYSKEFELQQQQKEISNIAKIVHDLKTVARNCTNPDTDKLYKCLTDLFSQVAKIKTPDDYLLLDVKTNKRLGIKANWRNGEQDKQDIISNTTTLNTCVDNIKTSCRQKFLLLILQCIRQYVLDYAAERKTSGTPNFRDTLVWCRDILKKPEYTEYFQNKYKNILVDEFQDTDPLQIEIIELITNKRKGALFLVGDPKQSIYRFRGADISAVHRTKKKFTNTIVLENNYRSRPEIINWINEVFEKAMTQRKVSEYEYLQANYSSLKPTVQSRDKVTYIQLGTASDKQVLYSELVKLILWLGNGGCMVREKLPHQGEQLRASTYKDICVLFRDRNLVEHYLEDSLIDHKVPYFFEGNQNIYARGWIYDIINTLTCIADPTNAVAVVAALRSQIFGISDEEIFKWHNAGNSYNYTDTQSNSQEYGNISNAFADLQLFYTQKHTVTVASLINTIVRKRHIRETIALYHPRPRAYTYLRLIDTLIEQAQMLQQRYNFTISEFLQYIQGTQEPNVTVRTAEKNTVKCMTIHNSKGREFPIVILILQSKTRNNTRQSTDVIFTKTLYKNRTEAKLSKNIYTRGFENASKSDKKAAEEEDIRLDYVAVTRARDHLFIGTIPADAKNSKKTYKIISEVTKSSWNVNDSNAMLTDATIVNTPIREVSPDRSQWKKITDETIQKAKVSLIASPSDMVQNSQYNSSKPYKNNASANSNGAKIGTLVHAILKDSIGKSDTDINAIVIAKANEIGISISDAGYSRALELSKAILKTDTVKRASSLRFWTESSVSAHITSKQHLSPIYISGTIDLVIENQDKTLTVVDYKTDALRGFDIATKAEHYELQIGAYAYALKVSTGLEVSQAILIFGEAALQSRPCEYKIENLEALYSKVRGYDMRSLNNSSGIVL